MKVRNIIQLLLDYNLDAEFNIIVHNHAEPFAMTFGNKEGCTKSNCDEVSLYLDNFNTNER